MSVRQSLLAATTVSIVAFAMSPASAQTLRYANQGDLKSLDPYTTKVLPMPISDRFSRA